MKCGECEYIRPPCGSGWPYDGERCGRTGVVVRSSDAQCELMILRARVAELEAERDRLKAESAKWNRAAERLEAALLKIRDYMPEQIPRLPDGWNDGCEECKEASKRKWPPSGLCNKHYSQADDRARSVELLENTQHYMMRKIAGDALKGSAPQAQEEEG